jgi:3-deoxy-D-arabino-heptulosonate 7-phosphate (DAHP) synthase class II
MESETQRPEMVLLNRIGKENVAELLANLIRESPELQQAILKVVWSCPNIVTRI